MKGGMKEERIKGGGGWKKNENKTKREWGWKKQKKKNLKQPKHSTQKQLYSRP